MCRTNPLIVGVEGPRPLNIGQASSGIIAQPRHPQQSGYIGRVASQNRPKRTPCLGILSLPCRGFAFSE